MRNVSNAGSEPVGSLAQRWEDLHASATQLAILADLAPEAFADELAAFPNMLNNASEWKHQLAAQGVEDIDAMMRPGLAALRTLTARGADPKVPAQALWREFHHAREAVLALVQPAAD